MDLLFWPCFPVSGPEKLGKLGKLLDGSWPTCLQKEFPFLASIWVDPSSHLGFGCGHTEDVFKQPGQSPNPER